MSMLGNAMLMSNNEITYLYINDFQFDFDGEITIRGHRYTTFTDNKRGKSQLIKRVIFNDPATIVLWRDGTKTVVKCQPGDTYDAEKGLALCIAKKYLGNKGNFNEVFKEWIPEEPITNEAKEFTFTFETPCFTTQEIKGFLNF